MTSSKISIITHDALIESIVPMYTDMWATLSATYGVPHVFKVGGNRIKGFVPFGPEHVIPKKTVCVMTPAEAEADKIETIELSKYKHPLDATYVFGPDNSERGWHKSFPDSDYVSIDTPRITDMFSFMAATMVLQHRWRSMNGNN